MARPVPPPPPRRHRTLLRALVILAVFAAALLFSLPAVLSTPWGLRAVLARVNAQGPYQVEAREWRLGWSRPPLVGGLVVRERSGQERARAQQIRFSRSLLDLLRGQDWGEILVVGPTITIPVEDWESPTAKAPRRPPSGSASTAKPGGVPTTPRAAPAATALPIWPAAQVRVRCVDAEIALAAAGQEPTRMFDRLAGVLALNPDGALADFSFQGRLPVTGGEFRLEGQVRGDRLLARRLRDLGGQARLTVRELPAGPALDLLSAFQTVPRGEGVWNADLSAEAEPGQAVRWSGALTGREVSFFGGPLAPDRLRLGDLSLATQGAFGVDGSRQADLRLTNALARVEVDLRQPRGAEGEARLDANIHLAGFARQLPSLFELRPDVALENGVLTLGARATGLGLGAAQVQAEALLNEVSGSYQGEVLAFAQPFRLDGRATQSNGVWRLDTLHADTPLGTLVAEGDAHEARAVLTTTLERAWQEAGKFIPTGAWEPEGEAQIVLRRQRLPTGAWSVEVDARSPEFSLTKSGGRVVEREPVSLRLSAQHSDHNPDWRAVRAQVQIPFFGGEIGFERFSPGDPLPTLEGGHAVGRLDLAGLGHALFHAGLLDRPLALATARVDLASLQLDLREGQLLVPSFDLALRGWAWRSDLPPLPDLALSGTLEALPALRTFLASNLVVRAGGVAARVEEVASSDWLDLPASLRVRAGLQTDLAQLQALAAPYVRVDPGQRLAGAVALEAGLRDGAVAASLVVRDFERQRGEGLIYRDPQMRLDARVRLPTPEVGLELRSLRLITGAATVGGQGWLRPETALAGELAYDLERVSQLLRDLGLEEIALTGRESSAWSLRVSPGGTNLVFTVALRAQEVAGYGLRFTGAEMPVLYSNQVLRLTLDGEFEGGRAHLAPLLRLDEAQPVLRLNTQPPLLQDVRLTPEIADRLLARLHPVFRQAAHLEGRLSLEFKHFLFPLAPDWHQRASFAGTVRLRGVRLAASGLAKEILDVAKIREQQVDIGDVDLPFVCRDGRVTTAPLVARIQGAPVEFSGSVGLDTTLQYQAKLTLTAERLEAWGIGSDLVPLLVGQSLTLPIVGTLAKPVLDRQSVQDQIRRLAGDAGRQALEQKAEALLDDLLDRKRK
jgi:hypothetical protein